MTCHNLTARTRAALLAAAVPDQGVTRGRLAVLPACPPNDWELR